MNSKSLEQIRSGTAILLRSDIKDIAPHLNKPLRLALQLIAAITDGITYEELSEVSGIHKESCKQIIRALIKSGYPLEIEKILIGDSQVPSHEIYLAQRRIRR